MIASSLFLLLVAADGSAVAQARASATILSGERIAFEDMSRGDIQTLRHESQVTERWIVTTEREGSQRRQARLLEFE